MSIVENILSLRERFTAKLQKANIFDNFFMRVVLENKEVCQYVLRKLLKKPNIIVLDCKTEVQISKLFGKDSRLDVLATDDTGKIFNKTLNPPLKEAGDIIKRQWERKELVSPTDTKSIQLTFALFYVIIKSQQLDNSKNMRLHRQNILCVKFLV